MNPFLQNVARWHVAMLVAAVAVAAASRHVSPISLFLGGAVMGVDLWAMGRLWNRLVRATSAEPRVTMVLGLMVLKFSVFLCLLGAVFWRAPIDPAGFGVGVTILLIACVAEALRTRTYAS